MLKTKVLCASLLYIYLFILKKYLQINLNFILSLSNFLPFLNHFGGTSHNFLASKSARKNFVKMSHLLIKIRQQNTITAQRKVNPDHNIGLSIQNCAISPYGNLTGVNTFLGRPWKNNSTTVFMHSIKGNLLNPKGWLPWTRDSAPHAIFYAEY